MPASESHLNRFERILFGVALALGVLLVALRLGAVAFVWYAHHIR
jgi:hypothetical protein